MGGFVGNQMSKIGNLYKRICSKLQDLLEITAG